MRTFHVNINKDESISFDCEDVPEKAEFAFACDSPNIKKDDLRFIVREIHNSRLLSKYAYFKISTT